MVNLKYSGQVKVCSCRFVFLKSFHVIVCILPAKITDRTEFSGKLHWCPSEQS